MFVGRSEAESRAFEEQVFAPVGAMVMDRRMADLGIGPWGDNPTFHMPVFIVSHDPHDPIVKDGGTTYRFVTDGLDSALDQARAAAGDKDIAIGGGANIVQQCLAADVIEEIRLHLVPVLLSGGVRLFDHGSNAPTELAMTSVEQADGLCIFATGCTAELSAS